MLSHQLAILCLASFSAGFVDSIVGGGGLIQLPALIMGLPGVSLVTILGTNKLVAVTGTVRDAAGETLPAWIEIQDRLFTIGSLLAADPEKNKMKLPQIQEEDITLLEKEIDKMNETLPEMKHFVLPGGHTPVSFCHVARCVCRRAERAVLKLAENEKVDEILQLCRQGAIALD